MADSDSLHITQSSTLSPAQPAYVLRGHSAQIHAAHFFRENLRLISGDADGWIVIWSIPIRRPVAVWKAHTATILGVRSWNDDKIVTYVHCSEFFGTFLICYRHGRDNKLCVWQLKPEDESTMSTILPIDDATSERKQPWWLHSIPVNSLNFCSFTMISDPLTGRPGDTTSSNPYGLLVGTPGVQDGHINVIQLPEEERIATIPTPKDVNTGMIMAIGLCLCKENLTVLAGYESGHAAVWQQNATGHWQTTYVNKSHSQPILSLDSSTNLGCFFTSSADAVIARHPLLESKLDSKVYQTKHAGQQSLTIRSDGKIFATAGWDGRARVYSTQSMKELAVLKWHKEGCYAMAFAELLEAASSSADDNESGTVTKRALTVSEQRTAKAKSTHWLAVGSKDGKVSLWDIY